MMVTKYIECMCSSTEHTVRFTYDTSDPDVIYLTTHLCASSFFQRIWRSLQFIFGHRCKYGDFDEILLDKDSVDELSDLLDDFKERNKILTD